jgi:hypothetical protein
MADLTGPNPDEVNGLDARGVAITAKPVTAGQAVDLWSGLSGNLFVTLTDPAGTIPASMGAPADAESNAQNMGQVQTFGVLYNGSTWDRVRSGGVTGMAGVSGDTAHDSVDAGNPVKIGGYASAAQPTAVATGDRVNAWLSRTGAQEIAGSAASMGDGGTDATGTLLFTDGDGTARPLGVRATLFNGTSWDRQRTIDAYKTAAAAPDLGLLATQLTDRRFTSVSLGTVIGNTQAWDPNGAAVAVIYVGTSTTGTYTFEVSADGTNWIAAETWDVVADAEVSGTNLTPTANKVYRIKAAGYRSIRARTVATLGGTVALIANLSSWQLVSTVNGNTPHDGVDAGNPLKVGGYAKAAAPTAVSDGDRVNAWFSTYGMLNVTLRDTSGGYVSPGGGTQYAEDAALGATPTGTLSMARRVDSLTTLTPVADDAISMRVSAEGALWVKLYAAEVSGNIPHDSVDSGSPVKIGGYASQGAPSTISNDADRVNAWLDRYGRQMVASKSPTATLSNVASSASNVTVLASNTARLGATVVNDSTQAVYLKFGATASSTSFTVKVAAGGYYEVPFGYTGIIDGIWVSANGNARVTELT